MKAIALTLALALPGVSLAQVCNTGHCPPVAATPVVTAAAAVLPLYGAGYQPAAAGDDELKQLLRDLIGEVRQLRAEVAAGPGVPAGAAALPGVDVFAVVKAKCASCHTGDKAKGEFQLLSDKGEFVRLSPADRRSVLARLDGKGGAVMPPPTSPPLAPAEKAALKAALTDSAPRAIPPGKK